MGRRVQRKNKYLSRRQCQRGYCLGALNISLIPDRDEPKPETFEAELSGALNGDAKTSDDKAEDAEKGQISIEESMST